MQRLLAVLMATAGLFGLVAAVTAAPVGAQEAKEFEHVEGWYQGRQVQYYDFGMNSATTGSVVSAAPIYVFIHGMNPDGSPDFVEGQHNIVDVVPGDDGYSDLWQVMLVTVPADYEPDSVRSKADLDAAGFEVTATDMFVNCPIVPAGSTLEGGEQLTQGWYKGEEVFYPDFGANPPVAIPIWVFITGFNDDGSPQFVEGQQNIIDSVPGDAGYSDFWRVNLVTVPANYAPNSIRSAADVIASGFQITETDMVVNCPVTSVAEAVSGGGTTPGGPSAGMDLPDTGSGPATGNGLTGTLLLALAAAGIVTTTAGLGYAFAIRRR